MACEVNSTDVSDNSEAHFNCRICLAQYKEPKLLPCGHTFCLNCLKEVKTHGSSGMPSSGMSLSWTAGFKICCPDCRRSHAVPKIGVSGFVTDYTTVEEMEAREWQVEMESKLRESKCGMCGVSDETYALCSDCNSLLCSFCSSAHKRMKVFEAHEVQTMAATVVDIKSYKPKSEPAICHDHFPTPVSMYCQTCQLLICTECITKPMGLFAAGGSHSIHTLHSLTESTLKKFEDTFKERLGMAEVNVQKLADLLQAAKFREMKLKEYPEVLKKAINDTIDKSISALESMRKDMIGKVYENQEVISEKALAHRESLSSKMCSLKSEIRLSKKAYRCTEKSRRILMLSHASSILQDTDQSVHVLRDIPIMNVVQGLHYNIQEFKLLVDFDPKMLTISNSGTAPRLKKVSLIIVKSKADMLWTPQFRILYGTAQLPVTVFEIDKDTWQLQFTPCSIGSHSIEINVFGTWYSLKSRSSQFHVSEELKERGIVHASPGGFRFNNLDKSQLKKTYQNQECVLQLKWDKKNSLPQLGSGLGT